MLKKTITFSDVDGNPITEDFYFNLNKAEIAEMQLERKGGLSEFMEQIIKTEDNAELIKLFKDVIQKSVGRRSEDGRRFIKNQEIVDDFMQTEAYSELFFELATKADAAVEFMKGIIPAGLEDEMEKASKQVENLSLPEGEQKPAWIVQNRLATPEEKAQMTDEQRKDYALYVQKLA